MALPQSGQRAREVPVAVGGGSLTPCLPAGATVAAARLDALSHALEAIRSVDANPVSDTHAVAAARTVLATLPDLMQDLTHPALAGVRRRSFIGAQAARPAPEPIQQA